MFKRIKKVIRSVIMLLKEEKKIPIPNPINVPELLKDKVALITGGSGGIAALATFMVSDMGDMIVGDTFYMTGGSGTITLHR